MYNAIMMIYGSSCMHFFFFFYSSFHGKITIFNIKIRKFLSLSLYLAHSGWMYIQTEFVVTCVCVCVSKCIAIIWVELVRVSQAQRILNTHIHMHIGLDNSNKMIAYKWGVLSLESVFMGKDMLVRFSVWKKKLFKFFHI